MDQLPSRLVMAPRSLTLAPSRGTTSSMFSVDKRTSAKLARLKTVNWPKLANLTLTSRLARVLRQMSVSSYASEMTTTPRYVVMVMILLTLPRHYQRVTLAIDTHALQLEKVRQI